MAYADFTGKIIRHSWGRCRVTLAGTVYKGDLINRIGVCADANANLPADFVACQDGVSGDVIWAAKKAEVAKASTIATGGVVTAGDHGGTAYDVLWLSATAGDAAEAPEANIAQRVGVVLDTERIILEPAEQYDALAELVAANLTLDANDAGKQMYVTADAKTITLPAGAAKQGLSYTIVNGGQNGDILVTVSPNAADKITGCDRAGTNGKDVLNTKATAKCGDRIEIISDGTATNSVWYVTKQIGTWAAEE